LDGLLTSLYKDYPATLKHASGFLASATRVFERNALAGLPPLATDEVLDEIFNLDGMLDEMEAEEAELLNKPFDVEEYEKTRAAGYKRDYPNWIDGWTEILEPFEEQNRAALDADSDAIAVDDEDYDDGSSSNSGDGYGLLEYDEREEYDEVDNKDQLSVSTTALPDVVVPDVVVPDVVKITKVAESFDPDLDSTEDMLPWTMDRGLPVDHKAPVVVDHKPPVVDTSSSTSQPSPSVDDEDYENGETSASGESPEDDDDESSGSGESSGDDDDDDVEIMEGIKLTRLRADSMRETRPVHREDHQLVQEGHQLVQEGHQLVQDSHHHQGHGQKKPEVVEYEDEFALDTEMETPGDDIMQPVISFVPEDLDEMLD